MNKKEIARIIEALEDQGFSATRTAKNHWLIRNAENRVVATLASTPSDRRGLANSIARLRRAGFIWQR